MCGDYISTEDNVTVTLYQPIIHTEEPPTLLSIHPQEFVWRYKCYICFHIVCLSASVPTAGRLLQQNELRYIDLNSYFPQRLTRAHLHRLCKHIFSSDMHIKASMRRGIWLHLVKAYPDSLVTQEQRELYIAKLRRVYDALKGQWQVDEARQQYHQLCGSVKRDATRTDPQESFFWNRTGACSNEENVQKLVNILAIYILEHNGVKYTQGMTDLLSPILYVMQREADAYICFAAMLERIKENFGVWCEGTLNKIERLRHLCMVLDPQLYSHLAHSMEEDAFALFFGMVLIECRREFSFTDSFHLLEVVWAATLYLEMESGEESERRLGGRGGECDGETGREQTDGNQCTPAEWASYMTYESQEVIQQVLGETPSPYSAQPLTRTTSEYSAAYSSRHPSTISGGRYSTTQYTEATYSGGDQSPFEEIEGEEDPYNENEEMHIQGTGMGVASPQETTGSAVTQTETSERNECLDRDQTDNGENAVSQEKVTVQKRPKELSDLSSAGSESNSSSRLSHKLPDRPDSGRSLSDSPGSSESGGQIIPRRLRGGASDHSFHTAQGISSSSQNTSTYSEGPTAAMAYTVSTPTQLAGASILTPTSSSHLPSQSESRTPASLEADVPASPYDQDSPRFRSLSPLDARLSPVVFFDRFERLASTIRSHQDGAIPRGLHVHSRDNSDISQTISLLLSAEQTAPHVTRENSLQVPVSSSFPLFVCLAILVQNRTQIMRERLDFVGLSVLLNAQAGTQDLPTTLRVAQRLLKVYQDYQLMYFGPGVRGRSLWLDAVAAEGNDSCSGAREPS